MTIISAQISLYPLGQTDLAPAIQAAIETLDEHGLVYNVGTMSTTLWGEEAIVWAALREAFCRAATYGGVVLQATISNACPVPQERHQHG